jgi:hypothetical protein
MIGLAEIIVGTVGKVIDRVFPDPATRDAAKLELLRMEQAGQLAAMQAELQLQLAQIAVNQADAQSSDPFQSRWRPAVGWVCCAGLAYQFVVGPLLEWGGAPLGWPPPPTLNLGDLVTILLGLLGLGGLRTMEKLQGKQ